MNLLYGAPLQSSTSADTFCGFLRSRKGPGKRPVLAKQIVTIPPRIFLVIVSGSSLRLHEKSIAEQDFDKTFIASACDQPFGLDFQESVAAALDRRAFRRKRFE
jgi:hypothetical protein